MQLFLEMCWQFGEVFISDDQHACALVLFPEKKKATLRSTVLDIQLVFNTVGLRNLWKTMRREKSIKQMHPKELLYHIWYIGVAPHEQGKGKGSALLKDVLQRAKDLDRTPVLETSTLKNIPWYQSFGFDIYSELDFGFPFYCMKA
ncbi:GNAT family N-acetyltransferase [Niabella ginsengisoli]|uniref:GNAT family N-acetyltransferase n=1 Tax=Niabella ginsengisoli TaxID=522298 RepID=A0ABS9SHV4_9BACT|nr:GNAT family N-acetyltransferase [Niabella ginsengisoli]MCH5597948.1 GNAT family N-acetyltransferase [Niabella ginsengisoli]